MPSAVSNLKIVFPASSVGDTFAQRLASDQSDLPRSRFLILQPAPGFINSNRLICITNSPSKYLLRSPKLRKQMHENVGLPIQTSFQAYQIASTYIYIYMHCITLHCIALHYITLRYATLGNARQRYVTLRYVSLRYVTLHYITLHTYIYIIYIYIYTIDIILNIYNIYHIIYISTCILSTSALLLIHLPLPAQLQVEDRLQHLPEGFHGLRAP